MSRILLTAVLSIVLSSCVLLPGAGAEELLATFGYSGVGTVSPAGGDHEWQPFLSYSAPGDPPVGFLNNVTMDVLDVALGSSPDLTGDLAMAALLATDGIEQMASIGFLVPNGGTGSFISPTESDLISTALFLAPGVGTTDLAVFGLTRIDVLTSSYQLLTAATFEIALEFNVYGNRIVPEPTSLAMFSLLGMLITCRRRY